MTENKKKTYRMVTGTGEATFVNIFTPRADDNGKENYSIAIMFDKVKDKESIDQIKKLMAELMTDRFGKDLSNWPQLIPTLKDGNEKAAKYPNFAGKVYMEAKTMYKPGIVDENVCDLIDKKELFSGCKIRIDMNLYFWERKGRKGISAGLYNVQRIEKAEPKDDQDFTPKTPQQVFTPVVSEITKSNPFTDKGSEDLPF